MALTAARIVSNEKRGLPRHVQRESLDIFSFYFISPPSVVKVVLSITHPAKFSEAVTRALWISRGFDFERDVQEFRELSEIERGVVRR